MYSFKGPRKCFSLSLSAGEMMEDSKKLYLTTRNIFVTQLLGNTLKLVLTSYR